MRALDDLLTSCPPKGPPPNTTRLGTKFQDVIFGGTHSRHSSSQKADKSHCLVLRNAFLDNVNIHSIGEVIRSNLLPKVQKTKCPCLRKKIVFTFNNKNIKSGVSVSPLPFLG